MVSLQGFHQRRSRTPRILVLAALVLILCVGAGTTLAVSFHREAAFGGSLTVQFDQPSRFVNPLLATTDTDQFATGLAFQSLTQYNRNGKLVGQLASRWWSNRTGTRYVFQIRTGLRWSNGSPVTANDVAYSWKLMMKHSFPTNDGTIPVSRITTPSPAEVVFTLSQPDYLFPSQTTVGIVPAHYAHSKWPIGSGPYRLDAVRKSNLVFVRRPDRSRDVNRITTVDIGAGHASSGASILSCSLSFARHTNATNIPTTTVLGLTLNEQSLPRTYERRAILSALRSQFGVFSPTPTWPGQRKPSSLPKLATANQALRHHRWRLIHGSWQRSGKSFTVQLVTTTAAELTPILGKAELALEQSGFHVHVKRLPFDRLLQDRLRTGTFTAAILDWNYGSPDYDPGTLWAPSSPLDYWHAHDSYLAQLNSKVPAASDPATRNRLRASIGARLISDGEAVGIRHQYLSCKVPPDLQGFTPPALAPTAGTVLTSLQSWYVRTKLIFSPPL